MKITKKVLDEMERCYCASSLVLGDESYAVLAGEAIGAPCYAYGGAKFEKKEIIWPSAGGTMSLVQIPGTEGEFLAVQNFFPGFKSEGAKIVWGRREVGEWVIRDVLALPFVHRFDILEGGDGEKYFFAATLCSSKKDREDWSDPGKLYACELPDDLSQGIHPVPIMSGLTKNHGYCRGMWKGRVAAFATCDAGIYAALPPEHKDGEWTVEQVMEGAIGEVALCDIDGDGEDELATIEPFHGDAFHIYKRDGEGWKRVYTYTRPIEFAHAVWGGELLGRGAFVVGVRRKNCELFMVQYDKAAGKFITTVIDEGVGTSNVAVFSRPEDEVLVAANHTKNEAAVYLITE